MISLCKLVNTASNLVLTTVVSHPLLIPGCTPNWSVLLMFQPPQREVSALALAPAGTPPFQTPYGNVAPRIGLAYHLRENQNWATVVRGGFGVFYDLATSDAGNIISTNTFPFGSQTFIPGGTFPLPPAA